jgi:hypothetical protein
VKQATILLCLALSACVTEAGHINSITPPTGKPGYVITCNSSRYDRCQTVLRVFVTVRTQSFRRHVAPRSDRQMQCLASVIASLF